MEKDPSSLMIEISGEPFEVNRRNTFLYTFLGDLATRNHVFIITEENPNAEVYEGAHIWEVFQEDGYKFLRKHIRKHNYTQYLNLQDVAEGDENAYERALARQCADVGDFIPDDFETGSN